MKAVVVRQIGGPVEVADVEIGEPGPGQVKVKVAAAGVCHSDLSLQNGTIPWMAPMILGHEGAGVVTAVGPDVDSPKVGEHVIFNWVPFCGSCSACRRGDKHLCVNGYGLSMAPTTLDGAPVFPVAASGTFAEEAIVHRSTAIPIGKDVPLDVAALVGCGVTTGVGAAINTAKVEAGSTVAVVGCGGVGMNVIQGAKICGASAIVAVDRFEHKAAEAKRFGATHAATPETLASVSQEVTGGEGFDYVFEVIGLSQTMRAAFDATRRGGTTVMVGVGRMDDNLTFNAFEFLGKEPKILGCVYGGADVERDYPRFLGYWKDGKLDLEGLISKRITLEEVPAAFEAMERGEVIRSVIEL